VTAPATESPAVSIPTIVIRPSRGWSALNLRELWRYRELIFFLTWRDVMVRYKQTLLGAAWAILKPFMTMVIFYFIFDRLAKVPTDGYPGPIFYFSGLLPWVLIQDGVTKAGNSLVTGANLITKVYFPRLAIPLASVVSGSVDFGLSFVVLLVMMAIYRTEFTLRLLAVPLFMLMALVTALGVGLWLSAMNVTYRDVGHVTPFMVQVWMYASPVVYSANLITNPLVQSLYGLNPAVGVIQGFRWAILGGMEFPGMLVLESVLVSIVLLWGGAMYFRRMERSFADVV
jgi:lipopolysaccharide transport system permease protein